MTGDAPVVRARMVLARPSQATPSSIVRSIPGSRPGKPRLSLAISLLAAAGRRR